MSEFATQIVFEDRAGGGTKVVVLDVGGQSKIRIPLDTWMQLSAVKYAVEQHARPTAFEEPLESKSGVAPVPDLALSEEHQALPHRH